MAKDFNDIIWPDIVSLKDKDGKEYAVSPGEKIVFPRQKELVEMLAKMTPEEYNKWWYERFTPRTFRML